MVVKTIAPPLPPPGPYVFKCSNSKCQATLQAEESDGLASYEPDDGPARPGYHYLAFKCPHCRAVTRCARK